MILPALCLTVVSYFGFYAIWGDRGLYQLEDVQVRLSLQQEKLAQLSGERDRLSHRISLMETGKTDPDLVEELARSQLMDGAPGQVAIARAIH